MTRDESSRSPQPRLSAECRAFLRHPPTETADLDAAARRHLGSCAFCAARAQARVRLGAMLSGRPQLPGEPETSRWLEGVRTRIVAQAEESDLGRLLVGARPSPLTDDAGWPEPLLESEVGRRSIVTPPCSPAVWAPVRQSILAGVARPSRTLRRRWMLGAVGAVLVAAVCLVSVSQGMGPRGKGPRGTAEVREVVFQDLDTMPDIEFSVVRYGALR